MPIEIQITDRDLPVLNAVAAQALELLQQPDATIAPIQSLIRQDPALTQRVLHTANSPFYRGRAETLTIGDAIVRLGLRQLRNVIIAAATGELCRAEDHSAQALWDHSLATAMACQTLADELRLGRTEEAFVAGMLHDVGKMVILMQHPEAYHCVCEEAAAAGRHVHEVENERFEFFTHTSVGGLVVRKWNLSDTLAEAVRYHHDLDRSIPESIINPNLACLVALANALVHHVQSSEGNQGLQAIADCAYARRLQVDELALNRLAAKIAQLLHPQPIES
jgi:putative nucleotidyltransferase with HDIG domain